MSYLRKGLEFIVHSVAAGALMLGLYGCANKPECWHIDEDNDGYNTCNSYEVLSCGEDGPCDDCDDDNPEINPGMYDEPCDDIDSNCDGHIMHDEDGDGYGSGCGDCNDVDKTIHPGAEELCDGYDNDCDGLVPDGEGDLDEDGYMPCEGDCDDDNSLTFPGAEEQCDGYDNDCNNVLPENERDQDDDTYLACLDDCNDFEFSINPGVEEICNGLDDNCDYIIPSDEFDLDGDGYMVCEGDCDDSNVDVYPGALEICDGYDNDCDGLGEVDPDGDGYMVCEGDCDEGNPNINPGELEIFCNLVDENCDGFIGTDNDSDSYFLECDDCDDSNVDVYPGAPEICDGLDNDCDSVIPGNEIDNDFDGYFACNDCDDFEFSINPGALEVCNGLDDNCDGVIPGDEVDGDGDGYMICAGDCDDTDPNVNPGTDNDADGYNTCDDCDDFEFSINPGALEIYDCFDNDCNGVIDDKLSLSDMADATFLGEDPDDLLGLVLSMGDFNNDSYDDIVVSSPTNSSGASNGGKVYVVYSDGNIYGNFELMLISDVTLLGTDINGYAGISMSVNNDFDHDNYEDILVGSLSRGYLFFGGPMFSGSYDLNNVDTKITNANNDGVRYMSNIANSWWEDLLVFNDWTSSTDAIISYMAGPINTGLHEITSPQAELTAGTCTANCESDFGQSLILTTDLDGDGTLEIIVANDEYNNATGKVYIKENNSLSGNYNLEIFADATIVGDSIGDKAGFNVVKGDLNDDGIDDLIIAAPYNGSGMVYVFESPFVMSGNLSVNDADVIISGEAGYGAVGSGLSSGDFNDDGIDDLIIGANNIVYTVYDFNSLPASVQLGSEESVGSFVVDNPQADNGLSVQVSGDVNYDGYDDLLVGEALNDENGTDSGKVYLVYGRDCN